MWELFCAKAEYYGQTDERCAIIMKKKFWEGKAMDTSEMKAVLDADFENLLRKLQVYVFFYAFFNLRNLLYIIHATKRRFANGR